MQIINKKNGQKTIKLSKSDWEKICKKAGILDNTLDKAKVAWKRLLAIYNSQATILNNRNQEESDTISLSGKKIKISQTQWTRIGKRAGWIK